MFSAVKQESEELTAEGCVVTPLPISFLGVLCGERGIRRTYRRVRKEHRENPSLLEFGILGVLCGGMQVRSNHRLHRGLCSTPLFASVLGALCVRGRGICLRGCSPMTTGARWLVQKPYTPFSMFSAVECEAEVVTAEYAEGCVVFPRPLSVLGVLCDLWARGRHCRLCI